MNWLGSGFADNFGGKMGNIRSKDIKKIAHKLRNENADKFSGDFEKNKQSLRELNIIDEKIARNRIAGYITRIAKHGEKRHSE
jgi:ribosomal protein S17E